MKEHLTHWLNVMTISRSRTTVQAYRYVLTKVFAHWPALTRPEDWTTEHLAEYLAARRNAGTSEQAIKQIVGALRGFFGYYRGLDSPARAIPYPKPKRRLQRVLDADQVLAVLASCDTFSPVGIRNSAVIHLMLDTGLRAAEVCNLQAADLDLNRRRLKVIVKGGNEEEAFFSAPTTAALAHWLAVRAKVAKPEETAFFVGYAGRTPGSKLTTHGSRRTFRDMGKAAGLTGFSPHDLRRTFATIAIKNGAPTRVVQAAGRWANVGMVELYTASVTAKEIEHYSPVNSLLNRKPQSKG